MNKLDYMSADAENEHNDEKRTLKKEDYDTEHNEDIYDEKCFKRLPTFDESLFHWFTDLALLCLFLFFLNYPFWGIFRKKRSIAPLIDPQIKFKDVEENR